MIEYRFPRWKFLLVPGLCIVPIIGMGFEIARNLRDNEVVRAQQGAFIILFLVAVIPILAWTMWGPRIYVHEGGISWRMLPFRRWYNGFIPFRDIVDVGREEWGWRGSDMQRHWVFYLKDRDEPEKLPFISGLSQKQRRKLAAAIRRARPDLFKDPRTGEALQ